MNSEILDRPPPHDLDAEKGVIGSVLIEPKLLGDVGPMLRPCDFHNERHSRLWRHVVELGDGGRGAVDTTLLQAAMKSNGGWSNEDAATVADIITGTPHAGNAIYYAKLVREKSDLRRVILSATEILRDAYSGGPLAILRQRIERAIDEIDADLGVDFAPMTLAQLMQRDVTVEYLIDNLIAARQPILLAGPVKSMKTSLLLDLCFALATGGYFLGYFRVLRTIGVGVLTGESGLPTIKDTLERIGRAAGIDPSGVSRLVISDRIPHLSNPAHLDALRRLILDYELELLAVDPAYLALDGADAGNIMIFGQQLRAVSELCQEMGVALLLCHHTKKGSGIDGEPVQLTDAAWSGFAEHCRQWLLVNHRERYDQESGTHRLWLAGGGSAGHGGLWAVDVHQGHIGDAGGRSWNVRVHAPNEARESVQDRKTANKQARQNEQQEADRKEIVAVAVKLKTPESKTAMRDRCQCGHARFGRAFATLVADGTLEPATVTKTNGQTYEGWKVRDEQ